MSNPIPPSEDTSGTSADYDASADRQRRIEALRAIARDQRQLEPVMPAATRPSRDERPIRRTRSRARWLIAGAAVVCIAVIGALVLRGLLTPPKHRASNVTTPPAMLTLDPTTDGIGCPYDVAWSPSGASIAVLGAPDCGLAGVVDIYDTTGKLTTKVQLDAPVQAALSSFVTTANEHPSIFYQHVRWSSDGRRLAVTFFSTFPDNPGASLTMTGVLVGDATGKQPRVLVEKPHAFPFYTRWDLSTGTGTVLQAAVPDPTAVLTLPPALSYQWNADGTLSPATPLPDNPASTAPAPVPVGNPDSGDSFTIWQPAIAAFAVHTPSPDPAQHDVAAQAYIFQTDFVAWSPDGRYLMNAVQVAGRFAPSGQSTPSPQQLAALGLAQTPALPVRDVALGDVLQQMQPDEIDALAWSRFGDFVAVQRMMPFVQGGTSGGPTDHTVTIYDCFTGQVAGILKPEASLPRLGGLSQLRWSPDASRLLLYDENLGTITIWGPSVLPKG
ncbi:MAG TPA: hypothetical protein VKT52_13085 [Ktedonobacterales bacterium]|nr:hypothetical protein [Ktedonobacterales bacterium]